MYSKISFHFCKDCRISPEGVREAIINTINRNNMAFGHNTAFGSAFGHNMAFCPAFDHNAVFGLAFGHNKLLITAFGTIKFFKLCRLIVEYWKPIQPDLLWQESVKKDWPLLSNPTQCMILDINMLKMTQEP
jgi:hypothetical protein